MSIESFERFAAESMGESDIVDLPIEKENDAYKKLAKLGVKFGEKVDNVLIRAVLPTGWKIVCNDPDPRYRELLNEKGEMIAYIFLKNTGYDYCGRVTMVTKHDDTAEIEDELPTQSSETEIDDELPPLVETHLGYKRATEFSVWGQLGDALVTLEILGKNNECRDVYDREYSKYRCSKARVYDITNINTGEPIEVAGSFRYGENGRTIYKKGDIVCPDSYDLKQKIVCSNGIHYFLTEKAARAYCEMLPISFEPRVEYSNNGHRLSKEFKDNNNNMPSNEEKVDVVKYTNKN